MTFFEACRRDTYSSGRSVSVFQPHFDSCWRCWRRRRMATIAATTIAPTRAAIGAAMATTVVGDSAVLVPVGLLADLGPGDGWVIPAGTNAVISSSMAAALPGLPGAAAAPEEELLPVAPSATCSSHTHAALHRQDSSRIWLARWRSILTVISSAVLESDPAAAAGCLEHCQTALLSLLLLAVNVLLTAILRRCWWRLPSP